MGDSKRNSFFDSINPSDERLQALKQLYPELFSDGKINTDILREIAGEENPQEERTPGYYGLYWPGKRKAKIEAKALPKGTLVPVPGDGVDEDTTHNIYIEGDNLEVLRILKQSYKGRVKMIYIDPPYNTGNDFIYPDNYKMPVDEYLKITEQADDKGKPLTTNQKSNGAFHTNWLNMMMPRLMLARELLTEDGVIFISIDDNEQANLKLLCDEVFGEENGFSTLIWESSTQPINSGSAKYNLQTKSEYIVMYARNKFFASQFILEEKEGSLSYPHQGKYGKCRFEIIEKSDAGDYKRETMKFKILGQSPRPGKRWQIGEDTARELERLGKIEVVDGIVKKAVYPEDELEKIQFKPFWSFFSAAEYGTALTGKETLNMLMEEPMGFDTVKSMNLMKELQFHLLKDDDIILDFFSGSATTAHATIQLNAEDNGKRRFIMVQLPHFCGNDSEATKAGYDTICEIGKERIRRAGKKILEEFEEKNGSVAVKNQLDIGFKVYRLDKSNFITYTPTTGKDDSAVSALFAELEKNTTPLIDGWKAENVLTEIILKQGFALDCECKKEESFSRNTVYRIKDSDGPAKRSTTPYVCLDNIINPETIESLKLGEKEKFICLDSAIDDTNYARLCDKGRIETI